MIPHSKIHRLLPLLAVSVMLAWAVAAQAQTSASIQVSFGTRPHWTTVPGTSVREIREDQRPDYDMFRYGGSYYVYQNNQWYMSRHDHGRFDTVDEQRVPRQFASVPREHWRNYPSDWADRNRMRGRHRYGDRNAQPEDHH